MSDDRVDLLPIVKQGVFEGAAALSLGRLLFVDPVKTMTVEAAFVAWSVLDFMGKQIDARKKQLRDVLLAEAKAKGAPTLQGHRVLSLLGGTVTQQRRESISIDSALVRSLLERLGIPLAEGGSLLFTHDEKKLEILVASGRLTSEHLAGCSDSKESFALVVEPPPAVLSLIQAGIEHGRKAAG